MRLLRTPLRPHARHQIRSAATRRHLIPSALVVTAGLVAVVAGTGTSDADAPRSVATSNVASNGVLDEATLTQQAVDERALVENRAAALAAQAKAHAEAQAKARAKAKAKAAARARAAAHARAVAHEKAVAHAKAVARAEASARAKAAHKTLARATYSAPAPHAAVSGAAGSLNWSALAECEASGNPRAYNGAGYYGLYQFDVQTWHSIGGQGTPSSASASEQTYRAQLLYKQRGASPWPVCGARLFS